jgi:raffinose/stachyose/melibiose transport system substrate-binding protein
MSLYDISYEYPFGGNPMTLHIKRQLSSVFITSLLLATACSNHGNTSETTKSTSKKNKKTVVSIFQGKVEIADQLKKLTDTYTKEHPNVKFDIQTVGGGADFAAALKAKFASGTAPDIFTNEGYQNAAIWKNKLEDLSNQPWVKDAYPNALKPMTIDGKVYGQPVNLEGYGFIYNKNLFKKADITGLPKTFSQLEETAKKLKAAGITAFSTGYAEWWILANHGLNIPFGMQKDPDAFIKGLNDGTEKFEGNQEFEQFFKLLDLTVTYGNNSPLTTDYNTEITQFAQGKTAMIQQGDWIQPMLEKLAPNMDVGILPIPLSNDSAISDKLPLDVPSSWVIYNKAPKAEKSAAKDFLNWMVSSNEGKTAMVKDFKYIPAFKTVPVKEKDIGPLGTEIIKYLKEGKTFTWQFMKYPDGASSEFAAELQAYIVGKATKEATMKAMDYSWSKLKK